MVGSNFLSLRRERVPIGGWAPVAVALIKLRVSHVTTSWDDKIDDDLLETMIAEVLSIVQKFLCGIRPNLSTDESDVPSISESEQFLMIDRNKNTRKFVII